MSFKLSNNTKKRLSEIIGIPYEKLIQMDDEEIERFIEQKTGKKITWSKGEKINGLPINTMEDVNKKTDELER